MESVPIAAERLKNSFSKEVLRERSSASWIFSRISSRIFKLKFKLKSHIHFWGRNDGPQCVDVLDNEDPGSHFGIVGCYFDLFLHICLASLDAASIVVLLELKHSIDTAEWSNRLILEYIIACFLGFNIFFNYFAVVLTNPGKPQKGMESAQV